MPTMEVYNDFNTMEDFAEKYGQSVDLLEEAMGGDNLEVDIDDFDLSNTTHAILLGLDSMIAGAVDEERAEDDNE